MFGKLCTLLLFGNLMTFVFLLKKSLKCNYFKTKTVRLIKRIFINSKRQRSQYSNFMICRFFDINIKTKSSI